MAGEVLELEVALSSKRVRVEELGQPLDLPRPKGDIDKGEALEDLLLDRLGPATTHADNPLGVFRLQALGLAKVSDEAVIGRLADRAGVEEDQIGLGTTWRLLIADRLEHPLHPLRVVHIHLTAERGYVVSLSHSPAE